MKNRVLKSLSQFFQKVKVHLSNKGVNLLNGLFGEILWFLSLRTLDISNSDFYIYLEIATRTSNEVQDEFHNPVNKNTKLSSEKMFSVDCLPSKKSNAYEKQLLV